jgi:hypothetical protein
MERMMGGSSGGSSFTLDIEQLKSAANERIREAFSMNRKLLFVCAAEDSARLLGEITRSEALKAIDWQHVDQYDELSGEAIASASLVVAYVHSALEQLILNEAIIRATAASKSCVFVRATEDAPIPQYVVQYRIRTLSWHELLDLIRR